MPVIQRQSTDPPKSITSADVSATDTLTLLVKLPATVTFYRGQTVMIVLLLLLLQVVVVVIVIGRLLSS